MVDLLGQTLTWLYVHQVDIGLEMEQWFTQLLSKRKSPSFFFKVLSNVSASQVASAVTAHDSRVVPRTGGGDQPAEVPSWYPNPLDSPMERIPGCESLTQFRTSSSLRIEHRWQSFQTSGLEGPDSCQLCRYRTTCCIPVPHRTRIGIAPSMRVRLLGELLSKMTPQNWTCQLRKKSRRCVI